MRADLRTNGGKWGVNIVVRIANRWSQLSRVGLKAELCERGANPRQSAEFQVEHRRNLETRVRGPFLCVDIREYSCRHVIVFLLGYNSESSTYSAVMLNLFQHLTCVALYLILGKIPK